MRRTFQVLAFQRRNVSSLYKGATSTALRDSDRGEKQRCSSVESSGSEIE